MKTNELTHDKNAERGVIAALVTVGDNGILFGEISEIVRGEDFFIPANRPIYEVIGNIIARGALVDGVSLANELKRMGKLESMGGYVYINQLLFYTQ